MRKKLFFALLFSALQLTAQDARLESIKKKAEQGDVVSQYELGFYYYSGLHGAQKNPSLAFDWTRKAANAGDRSAQFLLGKFYAEGVGVKPSRDTAYKWYLKAANQGHVVAQFSLASAYNTGQEGLPKSETEAFKWMQKSASNGFGEAQNMLGKMHAEGRGTRKDSVEAVAWWSQGQPMAEFYARAREALYKSLSGEQLKKVTVRREEIAKELALKTVPNPKAQLDSNGGAVAK